MLTDNEQRLKDIYERQAREGASGWIEMKFRSIKRAAATIGIVGAIGSVAICSLNDGKNTKITVNDQKKTSVPTAKAPVKTMTEEAKPAFKLKPEIKIDPVPSKKDNQPNIASDESIPERLRIVMLKGEASVINFENGNKWEGEISNNVWNGNLPNGYGRHTWADGSYFIGELYVVDMPAVYQESFGFLRYKDGSQYIGEFENYQRSGYGIMAWPDGKRFTGTFVNNQPDKGAYSNEGLLIEKQFSRPSYGLEQYFKFEIFKMKGIFETLQLEGGIWEGQVSENLMSKKYPHGFGKYTSTMGNMFFYGVWPLGSDPKIFYRKNEDGTFYIGEFSKYYNEETKREEFGPNGYALLRDSNNNNLYAGVFVHNLKEETYNKKRDERLRNQSPFLYQSP
jgi:MORN repeat